MRCIDQLAAYLTKWENLQRILYVPTAGFLEIRLIGKIINNGIDKSYMIILIVGVMLMVTFHAALKTLTVKGFFLMIRTDFRRDDGI